MLSEKKRKIILRFLTPRILTTIYYFIKYGAKISLKAEVDLSPSVIFGKDCVVSSFTKIKAMEGTLKMGDGANFATGCFVTTHSGGIEVGDNFLVGPNVNIIGGNYRYHRMGVDLHELGSKSRGIKIGHNVFVGAGTTILDGTVIGDNTIIVANSLLSRHYPSDSILRGIPAKIIKRREGYGKW